MGGGLDLSDTGAWWDGVQDSRYSTPGSVLQGWMWGEEFGGKSFSLLVRGWLN